MSLHQSAPSKIPKRRGKSLQPARGTSIAAKKRYGMAHLVPVVSLATLGNGPGADHPGHGHLDGSSTTGALESSKADLSTVFPLIVFPLIASRLCAAARA